MIDIRNGDSAELLKQLADNSIDLTVTSPPYDNLRTYNGYSFDFERIAHELYRVTAPGGVVVWIVGDATVKGSETGTSFRQALFFKECGFNLHDTMIWAKPNPVPTQSTRYQAAHEYMFVLSKGAPKAFNPLKEPAKLAGQQRRKHRAVGGGHDDNDDGVYQYAEQKLRNNYWLIPVGGNRSGQKHPAAFPESLARDHILSWSNAGDTVLDPFLGSGTTGKIALQLGRRFIGMEVSAEYSRLAIERIRAAMPEAANDAVAQFINDA